MKKTLLLFFPLISFNFYCQEVIWQKDIVSSSQDLLSSLNITIDRNFLVSGSSILLSKENEHYSYDYRLIKLNPKGQIVWEKTYGGDQHDFLKATSSTQEGGFLIIGDSFSEKGKDKSTDNFGGSDIWIMKLSENGEEEWQKSIGTSFDDEAVSAVQSTDLGYFIGGNVQLESGFGSKDIWIIKLDKKGNVQSHLLLGGNGIDQVEAMIPAKDGGCLVGVYSRNGNTLFYKNQEELSKTGKKEIFSSDLKDPHSFERRERKEEPYGEGDYWVIKLDKNANIQWQKNYGGSKDDRIKALTRTTNGYILVGESKSDRSGSKETGVKNGVDLWVIAIDEYGNEFWQRSYDFGTGDVMMSADEIWDSKGEHTKGFLLGGFSRNVEEQEENDKTYWLLYIDNEGKEVWRKYIKGKDKQEEERLISARLVADGSYVLAGTSAREVGEENWKIVKLGDQDVEQLMEKKELRTYPNPADEYIYVEIGQEFKEAEISIYDMTGNLVHKTKTNNTVTKLNVSFLPIGVYLINAIIEKQQLSNKFIKK